MSSVFPLFKFEGMPRDPKGEGVVLAAIASGQDPEIYTPTHCVTMSRDDWLDHTANMFAVSMMPYVDRGTVRQGSRNVPLAEAAYTFARDMLKESERWRTRPRLGTS